MKAKPAKGEYRRNLPHIQIAGKTYFVTFCTYKRWVLPEIARDLILNHCVYDHDKKYRLHGAVVMPDHVHMVISPIRDSNGNTFGLSQIMNSIKGASAHSVNKLLKRKGSVWQREWFDHLLRSDEKAGYKVEYICENPIRKGLVSNIDDYPWLWREWVEGM